jgi:hypothetical protein
VISEVVPNSNKQQHATTARVQTTVKTQQKTEPPSSAWTIHEETQGIKIVLIIFFKTLSHLFSNTIIDSSCNSTSFYSIFFSTNTK